MWFAITWRDVPGLIWRSFVDELRDLFKRGQK